MWPSITWNQTRTSDYVTVHLTTDCQTRSEYEASPGAAYHRLIGHRHLVTVPLPPRGPIDYRIMLWRTEGRNFSDRETQLLTLLRPHLVALHDAVLRRAGPAGRLTPRQLEARQLVAAGFTNAQIARRLGLSEGTVRRHLKNIFERLQVTSRTAAAACILRPS
jgi:DNA-binding CsgD family transcriptional regulator